MVLCPECGNVIYDSVDGPDWIGRTPCSVCVSEREKKEKGDNNDNC